MFLFSLRHLQALYKCLHVIDVYTHKTVVPATSEIIHLCGSVGNLTNIVQQNHKQKNDDFPMR